MKTVKLRAVRGHQLSLVMVFAMLNLCNASETLRSQTDELEPLEIDIRLADGPSPELRKAMGRWYRASKTELSRVRTTWTGLSVAIGQGNRQTVKRLCRRLHDEVARCRDPSVASAPDPIASLYLSRGIDRIDDATTDCSVGNLFALSFGLSAARPLFRQFDLRLAAFGIESQSANH